MEYFACAARVYVYIIVWAAHFKNSAFQLQSRNPRTSSTLSV